MLGQMMKMPLLISSLIDHADNYHGETEIVSVETSGGISRSNWQTVAKRSRKLASALGKRGIKQGDCCGTIAWNNHRHLEIYFGVSGGGMICHTINPRLAPEQMAYVINHADDQVLFLEKTFLPFAVKLKEHLKGVKAIVLMSGRDEEAAAQLPGLLFHDELVDEGDDDYEWPALDENTASSLCFTSGTTGNPKGVLYSHRSTVLHSFCAALPDSINFSARDCILPVVPMFHVNAWGSPYAAAMVGAKLVMPGPGLDGPSLLSLIDTEKVTVALGVPTIWQGLLAAIKASDSKIESLTRSVVGGAACPESMMEAFREYGVDTLHAWGMTEMSPLGTINNLLQKHSDLPEAEKNKVRLSQGRPPFGCELRIVDEAGVVMPNDGTSQGDLQCRGHWILEDYFKTDIQALTEGWFSTGDVATIDEDGFMDIRDRTKDIIKSGGEWISTVELENIAVAHTGLASAAVIAAKHAKWDERPLLVAVKAEGADPSVEELLAFYEGKIPKWQVPDDVVFVESLPLGATGKVMKSKLREAHGDHLL